MYQIPVKDCGRYVICEMTEVTPVYEGKYNARIPESDILGAMRVQLDISGEYAYLHYFYKVPKLIREDNIVGGSMEEKILGKIDYAEFGQYPDRPFLFGLQLGFKMQGSGVMDGGRYTVNISSECKWDSEEEKNDAFEKMLLYTNKILTDAKVSHISELLDKPVEITLKSNAFQSFRILTEVL